MKLWIAIALFAATAALGQLPAGLQPLNAEHLKNGKLVSSDDNFSIAVPSGNWEWFQQTEKKDTVAYVGVDREQGRTLTVTVTRVVYRRFERDFVEGVARGMRTKTVERGGTVTLSDVEKSDAPLEGAMQFTSMLQLPGLQPLHGRALIFKRGYIYSLQAMALGDPSELLKTTAASFALLDDPKVSNVDLSDGLMAEAFGTLALITLGGLILNALVKRRIVNGAAGSAYVILFLFVLNCVFLGLSIDRDADPGLQGEAFGALFGAVLIPLLVAIPLARYFERERVHERVRRGASPGSTIAGNLWFGIGLLIVGGLILGTNVPESPAAIIAMAVLQLLVLILSVVAMVRDARRKEIARLPMVSEMESAVMAARP